MQELIQSDILKYFWHFNIECEYLNIWNCDFSVTLMDEGVTYEHKIP